jgi:hypothetical protein
MRFLAVDAAAGHLLARDVPSDRRDGAPLLRAGTELTPELAVRVADSGCRGVWVDDELGSQIEPPPEFPADVVGRAHHAITSALADAPPAIAAQRELDPRLVRQLHEAADDIADAVLEYPANVCPINDLPVSLATAAWHAVRVTLLGSFIARRLLTQSGWIDYQGVQRFDLFDERLATLAFGLLVHDIGTAAQDRGLLAGPCMDAEAEQAVEHVSLGAALFPAESTPAAGRVVIHSHHERWDGFGYPERKHHDATAPNARIAAIADGYDALRATGGGREPVAINAAVGAIEQDAGSRFDPAIVAHFTALVAPYPVGHEVLLPDGRRAIVAAVPPGDPLRPTVRLQSASGPIVELVTDLAASQAVVAA